MAAARVATYASRMGTRSGGSIVDAVVDRSCQTPSPGRSRSDCGNAVDNARENDTFAMKLVDNPLLPIAAPVWFVLPEGATNI